MEHLAPHCTLAQLWVWTKWKSFFLSPLCKTAFPDLLCFSYLWPFVQWNQQNQWYFCFFPNSWCAFPIIEFYYKIFGISDFISIFSLLALQYSQCADTHGKHPSVNCPPHILKLSNLFLCVHNYWSSILSHACFPAVLHLALYTPILSHHALFQNQPPCTRCGWFQVLTPGLNKFTKDGWSCKSAQLFQTQKKRAHSDKCCK